MKLLERAQISIKRRAGQVVLRSDLVNLGSSSQLSEAIKKLTESGLLLRIGSGIYAKSQKDSHGRPQLLVSPQQIVEEVFKKLQVSARVIGIKIVGEHKVCVVETEHRISRKLKIDSCTIDYLTPPKILSLPKDPDSLPQKNVKEFVERYAKAHHVAYTRSQIDDLAEAITRASGDSVDLDLTGKLLVALKKKKLIDGRQFARLITNHAKETQNV